MDRVEDGWFTVRTAAAPGARYKFRFDDGLLVPDPASRAQSGGVHGWSVLVDPHSHKWRHEDWRGRPFHEAVIYEAHAGILGGYTGLAEHLPALADLGFTAIELMPVGAFSGTRNWGYDGVLPYAPVEAYGTPDELKALIDTAHGLGLIVYLDVVYNHFGPDGNFLSAYAAPFFSERDTGWGHAVAVDKEPVARFFIDNALMWLTQYRFDGLRFDAVHAIDNPAFLDAMAAELREATAGRHIHLILENEQNDSDRLAGPYDAQWNDDFHNVVHVLLTGETETYYARFSQSPAQKLARSLAEGFIYQGEPFGDEKAEPRGKPSGHLPTTAFVNFLQNHDQVGNRALGERLTLLTDHERLHAATALLLLSPFIPLVFMGDAIGSHSPFFFFTDFHDELADAVREGRRAEFAHSKAFLAAHEANDIPDPNALETFERSIPRVGPRFLEWQETYRHLLALRHREIVPRLPGTRSIASDAIGESAVMASWRLGDGATLTILVNFGDAPVDGGLDLEPLYSCGAATSGPGCTIWLETA